MTYDVIIVGAGPAGLSTALHLAQLDPELATRILVLEKARHPRFKLCGGGLVVDAESILARLGLDAGEVPHTDAEAIHFDFEGRGLKIRVPKSHSLRVIRRDEFDAWLAKKAKSKGIEIREGVTVKTVVPGDGGVQVETDAGTFQARAVVGADGSNGVVRRCVLPDVPLRTARVLEVLTPPVSDEGPRCARASHRRQDAYFDFFCVPGGIAGYVWDFPTQVNGRAMQCWGVYDCNLLAGEDRPPLREPLAEEMERHGFHLADYELKGCPIRWFDPLSRFAVPGVLLVGDAAGADPMLGEGISMALGYGRLAALSLHRAFLLKDYSFLDYRRRILLSPLGRALTARAVIAQLSYHLRWRWFQRLVWRHLKGLVSAIAWLFVINWARRTV